MRRMHLCIRRTTNVDHEARLHDIIKKHQPYGSYVHKTGTFECASRGSNPAHPD